MELQMIIFHHLSLNTYRGVGVGVEEAEENLQQQLICRGCRSAETRGRRLAYTRGLGRRCGLGSEWVSASPKGRCFNSARLPAALQHP